jgi:hypothetical protein
MAAVAGSIRGVTVLTVVMSLGMAPSFADVLSGVVVLVVGRCHGHDMYHHDLVSEYAGIGTFFGLMFIVSLIIALFGEH